MGDGGFVKVSDITDFPETGGKVKTLHPKIFGGLLCKYDDNDHMKEILQHDIPKSPPLLLTCILLKKQLRNMVPNHLIMDPNHLIMDPIHLIIAQNDIFRKDSFGGVTLIRAAAKNFEHILTITSPEDYMDVINYSNDNKLNKDVKQYYATKAFMNILDYDASISDYFNTIYGTLDNKDIKPLMFKQINHEIHHWSIEIKIWM